MESNVEISICIPAYKNGEFLSRLLDSIASQTFKSFEVIITDDTPDESIESLVKAYTNINQLHYFKNTRSLGTPENWNEGIRKSKGKWIKLMHNDDWFATPNALKIFHEATLSNSDCLFFFSAFRNVEEGTGGMDVVKCTWLDRFLLRLTPLHLFKKVYVGNPSCTMIRRDVNEYYDNQFKFVVDFEYYIRCIRKLKTYQYIDGVLLNIGFHNEQVTKYTFLVAEVQIPENLLLLDKLGHSILRNIVVYDYYWRMFRNLKVRKLTDVTTHYHDAIHPIITGMVEYQSKVAPNTLMNGFISKSLMTISYIKSLFMSVH